MKNAFSKKYVWLFGTAINIAYNATFLDAFWSTLTVTHSTQSLTYSLVLQCRVLNNTVSDSEYCTFQERQGVREVMWLAPKQLRKSKTELKNVFGHLALKLLNSQELFCSCLYWVCVLNVQLIRVALKLDLNEDWKQTGRGQENLGQGFPGRLMGRPLVPVGTTENSTTEQKCPMGSERKEAGAWGKHLWTGTCMSTEQYSSKFNLPAGCGKVWRKKRLGV